MRASWIFPVRSMECKYFNLPIMWDGVCFRRQLSLGWDCHTEGSDRKACIHRGHLMSIQRLMEADLFQKSLSLLEATPYTLV